MGRNLSNHGHISRMVASYKDGTRDTRDLDPYLLSACCLELALVVNL